MFLNKKIKLFLVWFKVNGHYFKRICQKKDRAYKIKQLLKEKYLGVWIQEIKIEKKMLFSYYEIERKITATFELPFFRDVESVEGIYIDEGIIWVKYN